MNWICCTSGTLMGSHHSTKYPVTTLPPLILGAVQVTLAEVMGVS